MKYIVKPIFKIICNVVPFLFNTIVLPIIKFLWAIILTITYFIIQLIANIFEFIWTFKITFKEFSFIYWPQDYYISPYIKWDRYPEGTEWCIGKVGDPIWNKLYTFKSYYHYIWGIKK